MLARDIVSLCRVRNFPLSELELSLKMALPIPLNLRKVDKDRRFGLEYEELLYEGCVQFYL
jgi:hypothetical protein